MNLALEAQAIEVTGITVAVEQNPIVPRDQVASSRSALISTGCPRAGSAIDHVSSAPAVNLNCPGLPQVAWPGVMTSPPTGG